MEKYLFKSCSMLVLVTSIPFHNYVNGHQQSDSKAVKIGASMPRREKFYGIKNSTLAVGNYRVNYTANFSFIFPQFITQIGPACQEMQPSNYTSGFSPNLYAGGGQANPGPGGGSHSAYENGVCEVDAGYYNRPERGGVTRTYTTTNHQYTEFDITIPDPSSTSYTFGNGNNNTVDFATVIRHELGHGVGLGHTQVSGRLMYPSVYIGHSTIHIGSDERAGYFCIYDNTCVGTNECGVGAISFSTHVNQAASGTVLSWTLGPEHVYAKGFNVYEKKGDTYISINSKMIKTTQGESEYAFLLSNKYKYKNKSFYLEIISNKDQDQLPLTSFKSE